jgi:hypothetical protein
MAIRAVRTPRATTGYVKQKRYAAFPVIMK